MERFKRSLLLIALLLSTGGMISCRNPFSPDLEFGVIGTGGQISDQKEPYGVFQNLQYAYTFKDTLIYGEVLDPEFIFTYRDYDLGYDVSWGRTEEMHITNGLLMNAERIDLVWNNVLFAGIGDTSSSGSIIRSFNLTITFNPSDIVRVTGRVNLQLRKNPETEKWRISRWVDESNF